MKMYNISSSACVHAELLVLSDSLRPVAGEASLSMGFARQDYWSGLPFPPPGDLPNPGIQLTISCISWHW